MPPGEFLLVSSEVLPLDSDQKQFLLRHHPNEYCAPLIDAEISPEFFIFNTFHWCSFKTIFFFLLTYDYDGAVDPAGVIDSSVGLLVPPPLSSSILCLLLKSSFSEMLWSGVDSIISSAVTTEINHRSEIRLAKNWSEKRCAFVLLTIDNAACLIF